ncbi:hypothetical protein ACFX2B_006345 [Malus domestica]
MSHFRLVRTRSVGVAFYARTDQERWCCLLCSCGPGALVLPFMLVQTRSVGVLQFRLLWTRSFVNLLNDPGEAFLAIFIARSLDRVIEEVFRKEIAHRDGDGRSVCQNFIIFNTFTLL